MPASIAAEMAEAPVGGEHYYALFATGIVLFCLPWLFNIVADRFAHRYRRWGRRPSNDRDSGYRNRKEKKSERGTVESMPQKKK
jgi:hypothetical protein